MATKDTTKETKAKKPTTDERLDALEAAVGITGAPADEETDAVPGEPLKQHELYVSADAAEE